MGTETYHDRHILAHNALIEIKRIYLLKPDEITAETFDTHNIREEPIPVSQIKEVIDNYFKELNN